MARDVHLADRQRAQELLEEDLAGMGRDAIRWAHGVHLRLVVVDEPHEFGTALGPAEHDPPRVGDTDPVVPDAIAAQGLQPVPRVHSVPMRRCVRAGRRRCDVGSYALGAVLAVVFAVAAGTLAGPAREAIAEEPAVRTALR
jgi:hypothetical protein